VATLHEGRPDYEFSAQIIDDRRSRIERAEQRRMVAVALTRQPINARVSDWWHNRLIAVPKRAMRSLFRFGFRATPIEMAVVSLPFALIFAFLITKLMLEDAVFTDDRLSIPAVMISIFMPCALVTESLAGRRPRMAAEILWPLSRVQYFRELLNASLLECFVLWLTLSVGCGIYVWYFDSIMLSWPVVSAYVVLGSSLQFLAFALAAHVAVIESKWVRLGGILLVGGGMAFVLVKWWNQRDSSGDMPFLVASLVITALAWPAMLAARNTWSRAELG
jgi:hypothetical protein